jgi:hypothetical protein
MKIIPLKSRGEPVVISLPLSQVIYISHSPVNLLSSNLYQITMLLVFFSNPELN